MLDSWRSDKAPLLWHVATLLGMVLFFGPKRHRFLAREPRTMPALRELVELCSFLDVTDLHQALLDLFGPVTLGRLAAASGQLHNRVQWMVQRLKTHRDGLKEDLFFFCGRCAMKTIQGGVLRNGAWSTPQIPGRPTRNQGWLPSPELPTPRFAAAAAVLGKDILVMGGYGGMDLDVTEKFDPVTNRWSRPPELQLSCARSECAAAVLDARVYLVAGTSWGKEISLVERCDGRGWEEVEPLSLARSGCAAAVTGGHLYVVGGFARGDSLRLFERFDGSKWTQLRPTLTGRWSCAAVGLQGSIYLCGGYNGGVPLDSVDRYDPRFGWWERVATLPTPRKRIAALAREDTLYIMGGFDGSQTTSVSEQLVLPSKKWKTSELPVATEWGAAVRVLR